LSQTPLSPLARTAGIVLLDPASFVPKSTIILQYTPDQLSRTLAVQAVTGDTGDRTEPLRLKGPPTETFKLEAELDATDQLEAGETGSLAVQLGIFPQLASLESLITPSVQQISATDTLLGQGAVEVAPMEAPFALFVWSSQRIVPVRLTELTITEEAFDVDLNPIRARVSLGMRVLSVNDLSYAHPGTKYYLNYLRSKELMAMKLAGSPVAQALDSLGITGLV
jgi:hypothetical protein